MPASRAAAAVRRREVVQVRTLRAGNRDRLRDWTVFVRAVVAAPAAFERVPAEGRGVVVIIVIRVGVVVVSRSCSSSVRLVGVSRDAAVASVVDPPPRGGRWWWWSGWTRCFPCFFFLVFFLFERSLVKRTNERTLRTHFLVLGFRVRENWKRREKKTS